MGMMKTWQIYLPDNLRTDQADRKDRADYYLSIWPYITEKWAKLVPLEKVFSKDQPLAGKLHNYFFDNPAPLVYYESFLLFSSVFWMILICRRLNYSP